MNFKLIHCNINITNIEKSVAFYEEALGPVSYTHLDVYKRQSSGYIGQQRQAVRRR